MFYPKQLKSSSECANVLNGEFLACIKALYLTGGQEAGGSSPLTQTILKPTKQWVFFMFIKEFTELYSSECNKYATLEK